MKEHIVDDSLKMVDSLLKLTTPELKDELTKQVTATYIFGMLNGKAYKESISPTEIQAIMIRIGIDKLGYSTQASYQMTQFVIDATDKDFHPMSIQLFIEV